MNFIVAVTNDYAIGKNNDLLFHLPTDLKYFKATMKGGYFYGISHRTRFYGRGTRSR